MIDTALPRPQWATADDAYEISEMETQLFENSFGEPRIKTELKVGKGFVLRCDKELMGYLLVRAGEVNDITRLAVKEKYQHQGVGRLLLLWALSLVHGPTMLYVLKTNSVAINLYQSCGFVISGEAEGSWLMLKDS